MIKGQTNNLRNRLNNYEVYRTPIYSLTPLLDYFPDWFLGDGYDPCAGDGRMMKEIHKRNPNSFFFMNDIREEEQHQMLQCPNSISTISDYLTIPDDQLPKVNWAITNPPFSKTVEFIDKLKTHCDGPVFVIQSMQFLGTKKRLEWFRQSGLTHILQLVRRPKWEVDDGVGMNNVYNFMWMVFEPDVDPKASIKWDWI